MVAKLKVAGVAVSTILIVAGLALVLYDVLTGGETLPPSNGLSDLSTAGYISLALGLLVMLLRGGAMAYKSRKGKKNRRSRYRRFRRHH